MARRCLFALLFALALTPIAFAVIKAPIPLKNTLVDNQFLFVAKVESVNADKATMVLTVESDLKGKFPFRRLPVTLTGDEDAKKLEHVPKLLKRLAPDLPTVWFVHHRGKKLTAFVYTNGTWMQILGEEVEKGRANWALAHGEPYLRGTFKGTTAELIDIVKDGLAGKKRPPEPNLKEPPGFGPEVPKKQSRLNPLDGGLNQGGPLFAVIPTVGLLGPLAILAILFPTVFGGVLILFRQWTAFITAFSLNSMLYFLHWWKGSVWFRGTWWNTDPALWFVMTLATLLCLMWAWRRQLYNLTQGADSLETPSRTEYLILSLLAVVCLGFVVGTYILEPPNPRDVIWNYTLVLTAATVVGLGFKIFRGVFEVMLPMATEGVMLGAAMVAHLLIFAFLTSTSTAEVGGDVTNQSTDPTAPQFVGVSWSKETPETGLFVSSPAIDGERIYAASAHPSFKGGTLFCRDLDTGNLRWEFIDDGDLKQVFSSPAVGAGKVFIGEGFHEDPSCKLYCVNAETGVKVWEHKTKSQTESSPAYHANKIYQGCGNDGFYCFAADAKDTGVVHWQFPPKGTQGRLLRFGAGAIVNNGKVFVGTGVDRSKKDDKGETAFFCLDADTGKQIWKVPTSQPVWAAPAMFETQLFVATGNGDVFDDDASPAGSVACLNPETGDQIWKVNLPNGVLQRPVVDAKQVYVSCRDGHCYALDRSTGKQKWKAALGSPGIAAPALARSAAGGETTSVFAIGTKGKLVCLNPVDGVPYWEFPVAGSQPMTFCAAPAVVVRPATDGFERRLIVLGGGDVLSGAKATLICLQDRVPVK